MSYMWRGDPIKREFLLRWGWVSVACVRGKWMLILFYSCVILAEIKNGGCNGRKPGELHFVLCAGDQDVV